MLQKKRQCFKKIKLYLENGMRDNTFVPNKFQNLNWNGYVLFMRDFLEHTYIVGEDENFAFFVSFVPQFIFRVRDSKQFQSISDLDEEEINDVVQKIDHLLQYIKVRTGMLRQHQAQLALGAGTEADDELEEEKSERPQRMMGVMNQCAQRSKQIRKGKAVFRRNQQVKTQVTATQDRIVRKQ